MYLLLKWKLPRKCCCYATLRETHVIILSLDKLLRCKIIPESLITQLTLHEDNCYSEGAGLRAGAPARGRRRRQVRALARVLRTTDNLVLPTTIQGWILNMHTFATKIITTFTSASSINWKPKNLTNNVLHICTCSKCYAK